MDTICRRHCENLPYGKSYGGSCILLVMKQKNVKSYRDIGELLCEKELRLGLLEQWNWAAELT